MTGRKALVVGIDNYERNALAGCVNDANAIGSLLETNEDESANFSVRFLLNADASAKGIRDHLKTTFEDDSEIACFYYSGHGYDNANDGGIVSADDQLIPFSEIMKTVRASKAKSKIVILDCCFSGQFGQDGVIGDDTVLGPDTVILTACSPTQTSSEDSDLKRGVYSSLLQGALEGGAANPLGEITPGSVYAYIDKSLNDFEQRPFFKANIRSFVVLRKSEPRVTKKEITQLVSLFKTRDSIFALDPSFEPTNKAKNPIKPIRPYYKESNGDIFALLQKMNRNGIVDPDREKHMYFAAMNSKGCKLTAIGRHYWDLAKEKKL